MKTELALPEQLQDLPARLGDLPERLGDLPGRVAELPARLGDLPSALRDVPSHLPGAPTRRGAVRVGRPGRVRRLALPLLVAGVVAGAVLVGRALRRRAPSDPMEPDSAAHEPKLTPA